MPVLGNELANEPRWASGTGDVPSSQQIEEMQRHIRACFIGRLGAHAPSVRILYGGSVKPGNVREIMALDEVGSALVGAVSHEAAEFNGVSREATP